jgi:DNA-binding transcriptional LysR family regulator
MAEMKEFASATLIGDLVGSRRADDRAGLHARLAGALSEVNERCAPVTPLRITVGDEYQGAFATVGAALQATLRLRLAMLPDVDLRHGVGWGTVRVLEQEPRVEDGPGWWVARDAISAVHAAEDRPSSRDRRTAYLRADGVEGPDPAAIEALLVLRDSALSRLSARSLTVLRDLMSGSSQREVAERLGISPSAVSQRVRSDGLAALVAADQATGGIR